METIENEFEEELTMDDFEQYMEGAEEKYLIDSEEMPKENSKTSESYFSIEDTISIDTYVNDYLGIDMNCNDLWHSGLKNIKNSTTSAENDKFMYILSVDNNIANRNPELVEEGYFLLVMDHNGHGNRATYINPLKIKEILKEQEYQAKFDQLMRKHIYDIKEITKFYSELYLAFKDLMEVQKIKDIISLSKRVKKVNEIKEYEQEKEGRKL